MTAKQKSELDTDDITDQRRIDNLQNMLAMIMKRSAEARTTPQSLVLDLLSEAGY